ncbi:MAG: TIGR01906 family membrane protein [Oscillospiraceae bacterium]|nr:TIGR01906 family membrane protein [Oscillospiraceae bacterium]
MKKLIYNLILPLSFLVIFMWSVIGVSQNRSFYDRQYQLNGTAEHIGIRHQDLMSVTDNLICYMTNQRPDLEMQYGVKGEIREIFDQREKLHMIDVRNLYMGVIHIAIGITAAIGAGLFYVIKKDGWKTARTTLNRKYLWSAIGLVIFCLVFGILIATNFQWFWTHFHYVFFTNDLWLLDPRISIMINMFPLNFFYAMVTRIFIIFIIGCIAVKLIFTDFRKNKA